MRIDTSSLPAYTGTKTLKKSDALNEDIISNIHSCFPVAVSQVKTFAKQFKENSCIDTARNVWNYLKNEIPYSKDSETSQIIQLPNALVVGKGDCKSFALFSCAVMAANGYKVKFRYAGYDITSTTPTHVYCVVCDEQGREIIIDAVWNSFNSQKKYTYKKDYAMKVFTLSGVETMSYEQKLQQLLKSIKNPHSVVASVVTKEINRLNGTQINSGYSAAHDLNSYRAALSRIALKSKAQNSIIIQLVKKELAAFENGTHDGTIAGIGKLFKGKLKEKIKKGVKQVAAQPLRAAFISLVVINFASLAKQLIKLKNAHPDKYKKFWENWGGKVSALDKAVKVGEKFVINKKGLKGYDDDHIQGIGVVQVVALVTAATPIILGLVKLMGGKKAKDLPELNAHDAAMAAAEAAKASGCSDEVYQDLKKTADLLPDTKPDVLDPTDYHITDSDKSGFSVSTPVMLVLAAAGIFLGKSLMGKSK